ncbi:vWA domain-containing protein [Rhodoferax antarcticus]|uniref:Mg-chelatase subunit ChlD-like protein n=1 Tax=Rhodoferax antarcticus ANT.BR TaxID=1111071 RepID=A0A1Q8YH58_9BURK|nr:VWA domain-containing protein [Rhodoferax antarcticus]APW48149.1 hypothetical protein RA876_02035 [Rhodoferax antarcticus]MCW2311179.1 magnesium chelatase subunit ChlD-like protein [Rhodoferax antarcticus]OLP07230.1 Mg-chelatase subunit ChlD-like protein [Rhodoferax antarcticus ANT.BR]
MNSGSEVQQASAGGRVAWLPTLLAKGAQPLQRIHLRHRTAVVAPVRLHLLLLDTSGSMRQGGRLALAKGYAARLIEQAARAGDQVGLLVFGGAGVELLLAPGPARRAAAVRVLQCAGGGGTPLAQALEHANQLLAHAQHRGMTTPQASWLWLLTDGRTLEIPAAPVGAVNVVVVDFEERKRALGRCATLAERWGAAYQRAPSPGESSVQVAGCAPF